MNKMILLMLLLGTSIPLGASAAPLCHEVLIMTLPNDVIDRTLQELAEMKLDLDLAKAAGDENTLRTMQEIAFINKKSEILVRLNLKEQELQKILIEKIAQLQKTKKAAEQKITAVRQSQVLVPPYTLKKSIQLRGFHGNLGSIFLNQNKKRWINHIASTLEIYDIETGSKVKEVRLNQGYLYLPKQDIFLGKHNDQFYTVDPKNPKMAEIDFAVEISKSMKYRSIQHILSPDKNSILLYNEKNYYFYDIAKKAISVEGKIGPWFQGGWKQLKLLPDNSFLVFSENSVDRVLLPGQSVKSIASNVNQSWHLMTSDQSQIIVRSKYDVHFHNMKTFENQVYRFGHEIYDVMLASSPDLIWITTSNEQIHLFSISQQKIVSSLPWEEVSHLYEDDVNLPFISVHSDNFRQNSSPTGLYSRKDLKERMFNFDERYSENGPSVVIDQTFSSDGSMIVNIVQSKTDDSFSLETWEKAQNE